jgi:hypothetical protein
LRFACNSSQVVVADLAPGDPEPLLVALDMLARSDAAGLERAILSALPYVDEIVVGIDARSDAATRSMAQRYADVVWEFGASDLHLTEEQWQANKIDFGRARNLGRERLHAPWALMIDTDEYLHAPVDFRALAKNAGQLGAYTIVVRVGQGEQPDCQRFARSEYRWFKATHNQLLFTAPIGTSEAMIVQDTSLRSEKEIARRTAQRQAGVEDLRQNAENGEIIELFHYAKHIAGVGGDINEAVRLIEDYRLRLPVHTLAVERAWLALLLAFRFYQDEKDLRKAEMWAVRALLDGPHVAAFCLLGDVAEDDGDFVRAERWYQIACATEDDARAMTWPQYTAQRYSRLAEIKQRLTTPPASDALRGDPAPC